MKIIGTNWIGDVPLPKRVLLAIISATATHPVNLAGYDTEEIMHYVLIGGIFGALVLVPFITSSSHRTTRIAILVVSSALIYWLAVHLALSRYGTLDIDYPIVASGLLGAVLVGLVVRLAAPFKHSWKYYVYVPLAGLIGGIGFQEIDLPVISYALWQVPVCLGLHFGRENSSTRVFDDESARL